VMDQTLEERLRQLLQSAPVDADEATREAWLAQLQAEERQALEDLAAAWITARLAAWLPFAQGHGHAPGAGSRPALSFHLSPWEDEEA